MRYFDISVSNPAGSVIKHWTSHPAGNQKPPDPGALKVEVDIWQGPQGLPLPGSWVRIWGISLTDIGQASNLNNCNVVVRGGMGRGLPLANPAQAGTIIQGTIQQAFANWIGTTMTLDLIVVAGSTAAGTGAAQNFVVNWPAGTTLATALSNLLNAQFPDANISINISSLLKNAYDELHYAGTWGQLAKYLIDQSRRILNTGPALSGQWNTPNNAASNYPGVQVHLDGKNINVYDGTISAKAKPLSLNDLVGQPTWLANQVIQVTCVMRGDISIGDYIQLPPTRAQVTSASMSQYATMRQDLIFNGVFQVNKIHQVGNYKDPGALSWVTVLDAAINTTTDADGNATLNLGDNAQQQADPVGALMAPLPTPALGQIVINSSSGGATGEGAGLTSSGPAPSTAFTEEPGLTGAGTYASPATSSSVGLKQSSPAPSLGQAITIGQPFNPGM